MPARVLLALCGLLSADALFGDSVDVRIEGVKDQLRDNVEAHLSLLTEARRERQKDEPPLAAADIQRLYRSARAEIEAALQPFGYYDPVIETELSPVSAGEAGGAEDREWLAEFRIDPGPATRLREVALSLAGEGQDDPGLARLLEEAGLRRGERLNQPAYNQLKSALQNDAYGKGYLDSGFSQSRIAVHPEAQAADVTLAFDTGPQYYFGDITVEQSILSREFIDKFIAIEPGDRFDPRGLTNLQLALSDSDYFSSIEVDVQRENAVDQRVPVRIMPTPARPQKYEASLGYGTDTGVRGGLGVLWRRINQQGHQFRTDIRLSQIQQSVVAQYKIPVGDVRSEFLDFSGDIDKRKLNDVDATRYSLGSSLNQNRWGGRRRLSLLYQHESWVFGDQPRQSSTLLIPGLEYERIQADDMLFTRRGYSLALKLNGAAEGVLSDATYIQALAGARFVHPLGEGSRLLLRGEYGATETGNFDKLPPSQRFFTGGAQTVRGYGFEELSPRDAENNLVGGQYLGVASVEVDYLFYGNFGLAAFVDTGNASDTPSIDWKTGAGIGLRYKSPVGMVRIDFAHPFDDPDSSFAFHISFGPDLQ